MEILVINSGSSSIKFQWLESKTGESFFSGLIEKIGFKESRITIKDSKSRQKRRDLPISDHKEALSLIFDEIGELSSIRAVGHRVVNGGEFFSAPCLIDDEALEKIKSCIPLAPLHNPANCMGIEAAQALLPEIPHIAVFDTSFHRTIDEPAFLYSIPYDYYSQDGIRRYGFHGSSHKYVTGRAADILGIDIDEIRGISCHLGNGASVTAIENGKSIDTSMGFGTLSGVTMGTRPGDLDPAVILYMLDQKNMSLSEISHMLYNESGLKGLSGLSSDMRDLLEAASRGHERSYAAVDIFVTSIQKYIGAYLTRLDGKPDFLLFTAGIGENSSEIRRRVISGLGHMGFVIDEGKNKNADGEALISTDDSETEILVIPTNEEWMIARDAEEKILKDYIPESSLTF